jgi:microcystin-dependent protein
VGMGHLLADAGGTVAHTLAVPEISHTHTLKASINQASTASPGGNVLAAKRRGGKDTFHTAAASGLDASAITTAAGGGQPHDNLQPYLGVTFVIALVGVFPSQN